jgi:hypothetical protein
MAAAVLGNLADPGTLPVAEPAALRPCRATAAPDSRQTRGDRRDERSTASAALMRGVAREAIPAPLPAKSSSLTIKSKLTFGECFLFDDLVAENVTVGPD